MARPTGRDIRDEVLTAARSMMQRRGATNFTYGDLAEEVGVRAPSIHHHFGRKDDLIAAATCDYREAFQARVEAIATDSALQALSTYAALYATTADADMLCLCGAVAADWTEVDDATQAEVDRFFVDQIGWVEERFADGQQAGEVRRDLEATPLAITFVVALEGAVLAARTSTGAGAVGLAADMILAMAAAPSDS